MIFFLRLKQKTDQGLLHTRGRFEEAILLVKIKTATGFWEVPWL